MKFIAAVFAIVLASFTVFSQVYQTPEREVISLPEITVPAEAVESGLRGTVRVGVTVNNSGNVVSVGEAYGPDDVCPSVSRPDVVAMRDTAKSIAAGAKFSPNFDAPQPIEQTVFLEIVFPGTTIQDEKILSFGGPVKKEEKSDSKDRFTVIGDRSFSVANSPPDYKGPVNTTATGSSGSGESRQLSGGVLNGKTRSLPKPPYPPAARAVRASGAVTIQVVIDESGSVFRAKAVSGHPLLRSAARNAACGAQFAQTLLSGNPVKVSGIITYNFVAP